MGGCRSLPVTAVVSALLTAAVAAGSGLSECEKSTEVQDGRRVNTTTSPDPAKECFLVKKISDFSLYLKPGRNFRELMVKVNHFPKREVGILNLPSSIVDVPNKWYNITVHSSTHRVQGTWHRTHFLYIDEKCEDDVQGRVTSDTNAYSYFVWVKGPVSFTTSSRPLTPRPTSPNTQITTQGQEAQPVPVNVPAETTTGSLGTWRDWYTAVIVAGAALVVTVVVLVVVRGRRDTANQRNANDNNAENYLGNTDHESDIYEEATEYGRANGESKVQRGSLTLSINSIYVPFEMTQ